MRRQKKRVKKTDRGCRGVPETERGQTLIDVVVDGGGPVALRKPGGEVIARLIKQTNIDDGVVVVLVSASPCSGFFLCIEVDISNREAKAVDGNESFGVEVADAKECRGRFLRVKVQIEIDKPLKRFIKPGVDESERIVVLPLIYELLPNFCYAYGRINHVLRECPNGEARIDAFEGGGKSISMFERSTKGVGVQAQSHEKVDSEDSVGKILARTEEATQSTEKQSCLANFDSIGLVGLIPKNEIALVIEISG
ncbi:hypothetical protein Ddye_011611 [Dipteronia dyeriana]|uniref:Zinc knuckle CX2CX4HX4C domain-containing protein n=1 Tax=Dipteronia dyeriana TaxID=168575 RepID=A0AAD9X2Y5_9ROSI|nr:hypothetical protein Ddye_011611 [Dipteronia dyeriana]